MRATFLSAILLLTLTQASEAQVDVRQCASLASVIVAPRILNASEEELRSARHYARCEARSTSSAQSVEIGYKAFSFSGDAANSDTMQDCQSERAALNVTERQYQNGVAFFREALPTIDKCIAAVTNGWAIDYQLIQRDAASISISNGGNRGGTLYAVDLIAADGDDFSCTGLPESFPAVVSTTEPVTMLCHRKPKVINLSGLEIRSAQDATINLRFSDGPLPITLPGYQSSVLDDVTSSLSKLQADVRDHAQRLDKYADATLNYSGPPTEAASANNWASCPDGQYVSAIFGQDTDRGGFCGSCISVVRFQCRPLPKP